METKSPATRGQLPSSQCFLEKIAVTDNSLEFEWNIPDFFLLERACRFQRDSPKFQFLGAEWTVRLFVLYNDYYNYIYCKLKDGYSHLNANYTMEIKYSNGAVYKSVCDVVRVQGTDFCVIRGKILSRSALIKDKEKVVPQDVLTIFCSICDVQKHCEKASTGLEKQNEISEVPLAVGSCNLGKDLQYLLTSGEHSDVVMKVGEKEFLAHRAILTARSTVFASMFRHDMKEQSCGTVDITDCDPQAFEQFLLYVYTGKVDSLASEKVCPLYQLSNKYDIQDLETECCIIKLGQQLKNLLASGEDNDVVMKVGDKEFPAHRAILRARSTVFSSVFRHDMKKRACGSVEITDCDPQAFEQFLLYVYTGKVDCLSMENVCQLYQLSDKYDIQDLKTECVEYMKKNLSADNFCDVISLALRHYESELIETTTEFFVKNAKKIVTTVKWFSFIKENPVEANELTLKMLNFVVPD